MIVNLPLYLSVFTATALLFMRKTFSYYSIGPLYSIELLMITAFLIFSTLCAVRRGPALLKKSVAREYGFYSIAAFSAYSVTRALLSPRIDLQNLIPGIYPAYIIVVALFGLMAGQRSLERALRFLVLLVACSPFIPYVSGMILFPIFGAIESPGWTYLYALSAATGAFLFSRLYVRLGFLALSLGGAFLAFERATFVNIALTLMAVWWLSRRDPGARRDVRKIARYSILLFVLAIVAFPFFFSVFFSGRAARFDVTVENILGFFLSIFKSEVTLSGTMAGAAVSGTRNHRLIMWGEALGRVFESPWSVLFGVGYGDTVAQGVSFRNVHNGYITVFYRNGLVGLGLFGWYSLALLRALRKTFLSHIDEKARRAAVFASVAYVAVLADALTGTIIDSPFTSFIAYAIIGLSVAYIARSRGGEDPADADIARP